jgi:pimeloyl-ACP methyl ester carboxylesterase
MIRKSMPSGYDPMGGSRFSFATNAERVCAEIMLKFNPIGPCTPEEMLGVAASIPGSEAAIMKGLGHFPMSENPKVFLKYLLPVLEKIGAR